MGKKDYKYQQKVKPNFLQVAPKPELAKSDHNTKVRLSFEYSEDSHCLSLLSSEDVRNAVDCFRRLNSMTWVQVYQTASKTPGMKTGLHWNPYEDSALKVNRPGRVSEDHKIAGIRAGDKYRIFGFRFEDTFHVLWFDPEHKICPA
ncbi:MAG: hypothetical protein ACTHN5_12520 [Phycisphaerae bacterium]